MLFRKSVAFSAVLHPVVYKGPCNSFLFLPSAVDFRDNLFEQDETTVDLLNVVFSINDLAACHSTPITMTSRLRSPITNPTSKMWFSSTSSVRPATETAFVSVSEETWMIWDAPLIRTLYHSITPQNGQQTGIRENWRGYTHHRRLSRAWRRPRIRQQRPVDASLDGPKPLLAATALRACLHNQKIQYGSATFRVCTSYAGRPATVRLVAVRLRHGTAAACVFDGGGATAPAAAAEPTYAPSWAARARSRALLGRRVCCRQASSFV